MFTDILAEPTARWLFLFLALATPFVAEWLGVRPVIATRVERKLFQLAPWPKPPASSPEGLAWIADQARAAILWYLLRLLVNLCVAIPLLIGAATVTGLFGFALWGWNWLVRASPATAELSPLVLILVGSLIAAGGFKLRQRAKQFYAGVEITVALAGLYAASNASTLGSGALAFTSSVYVLIRGLTNNKEAADAAKVAAHKQSTTNAGVPVPARQDDGTPSPIR